MKDNLININLETSTAPIIQEIRGKDYIEYGTDEYRNLYPQFLIDLYYNSSTHAAIINATSEMIAGQEIVAEETDNLEAYVKLQKFIANANSNETLHEVIKKCAFDFKLQGGFALNIIWSKDRTEISEIYHIPVERLRVGLPNEMGRVDKYYISADWKNTRKNKPQEIPAFSMNDRTSPSQILYTGLYSPNMEMYYTPDYSSCCNWALIDQKVSEFHLNNIQNGFSGSYFINFNNGIPTQEERLQIERSIEKKFTGEKASGRFVLSFSDSKDRAAEITPISMSNADKQYVALQELLTQNIMIGHRVTSPMLLGVKTEGQLGGRDELMQAFEIYQSTVVKPYQEHILKIITKILTVNNINLPVSIKQVQPIASVFGVDDMKEVMTQDEIREMIGLAPLQDNEVVAEEKELEKVANIDGMPVYDSKEEAIAKAEELGCSGYHEHEYNGKTVYMPCANHDQITNLSKDCNCEKNLDTCDENCATKLSKNCGCEKNLEECDDTCTHKTELEAFLAEFGEEMDDSWEIINEEDTGDEMEDFDFENELNANHIQLASTGSAYPNRKSGQDQTTNQEKYKDHIYRVRYRYAGKKSGEREFCRKMLAANKIYRKEDILEMGKRAVNPGWGRGGSDKYSIWKYKGGANCYHKWFRIILVQKGNRPKNSDEVITSTEAKSRGVKLPRNAQEVSVAPIDMPNQGFVNKR
ncbi:MAG: hypothetical protein CML17_03730 [Pusillimonas sp.]|nr:hypothetical protein [Pusillimonas sp.]